MSPINGGYDARQVRSSSGRTAQEVVQRENKGEQMHPTGITNVPAHVQKQQQIRKEQEQLEKADRQAKARDYYSMLHARAASEGRLYAIGEQIYDLQEKGNLTPQDQSRLASLTETEKQERSNFDQLSANVFSFWKNNRDIANSVDNIFNKGTGILGSGDSLRDQVWEQAAAEATGRTPQISRGTVSEYLDAYVDKHPQWGSFARFVSPVDSFFGVYENIESGRRNSNINDVLGEGNEISEQAKANSSNHTSGIGGGVLRGGVDAAMTAAGVFGPAKGVGSAAAIGTNAARTAATQAGANVTKAQLAGLFGKEVAKGTGNAFKGYYMNGGGALTGGFITGGALSKWYNSKPAGTTWTEHMTHLPSAAWDGAKQLAIMPFDPRFSRRYLFGTPLFTNDVMDGVDNAVGQFYHNAENSSAFNDYIETTGKMNSGIIDQEEQSSNNNTTPTPIPTTNVSNNATNVSNNTTNDNNTSIFGTLTNSIKNHPYAWGMGAAGALGLGAYMAYRNSQKEEEEKKKKLQQQQLAQYYGQNSFNKAASKTSELQLYLQYKKEIG